MNSLFQVIAIVVLLFSNSCQPQEPILPELDRIIVQAMTDQNLSGAVLLVAQGDDILHHRAYGYSLQYHYDGSVLDSPHPMQTGSIFDLASLTKVYATTFALMMLVDDELVGLDDPITKYLPDYPEDKSGILVRHLLAHTSGLLAWQPVYMHAGNPDSARKWVAISPMQYSPGEDRSYSDLGFMTLGYLVEKASGQPLDRYLEENLYKPLALNNTGFTPPAPDNIVATSHGNPFERRMIDDDNFGYYVEASSEEFEGWRNYVLHGEVNDGNAWYAHQGVAGHAGLFSTAYDVYKLSQVILNNGVHEGRQIISPATLQEFLQEDRFGNALGWIKDPATLNTDMAPASTIGHTGFTGTSAVLIPDNDTVVILLTNRQHGFPDGAYPNLSGVRGQILEAVLELTP